METGRTYVFALRLFHSLGMNPLAVTLEARGRRGAC
jgi:hypothetical protein